MSVPDPVTTGLVTATVLQVVKQGQDFIAAAAGYPGESLGTIVGKWAKRRLDNAATVGSKAHFILLNIGQVQKTDVELKVLQPLIEAASLEENDELQNIWANLLAQATDPRELITVSPIFPYILRDFGSREVKFLDALYEDALKKIVDNSFFNDVSRMQFDLVHLIKLFAALGFDSNIEGDSKAQGFPDLQRNRSAFYFMMDVILRHDVIREVLVPIDDERYRPLPQMNSVYHLSELGSVFVKACRPPSKAE
jgi:hypothetical protein